MTGSERAPKSLKIEDIRGKRPQEAREAVRKGEEMIKKRIEEMRKKLPHYDKDMLNIIVS